MPVSPVLNQILRKPTPDDLLTRLAIQRVAAFADWGSRNGVQMYIGELGWPNRSSDGEQWNKAMGKVLAYCEQRGVPVSHWATGCNRNGPYALSAWTPASFLADVSQIQRPAKVWEPFLRRGVSQFSNAFVTGGHNKSPYQGENPSDSSTGFFSNVNVGTYGTDYKYDTRATFDFLFARGVRTVKLSYRWERIQRTLGGAFDATEQTRFTTSVTDAIAAGLRVIVQPFNKGAYYLHNGTSGDRKKIGIDAACTSAHFSDHWTRMANLFVGEPGVIAYGLMNEPSSTYTVWRSVTQAAVDAIRAVDTAKTIIVPQRTNFVPVSWPSGDPTPWITDAQNKIRYEGHLYLDLSDYGLYTETYDEAQAEMATGYRFLDSFTGADVSPLPPDGGEIGQSTDGWSVTNWKRLSNQAAPISNSYSELGRDSRFPYGTLRTVVAAWDTTTASREMWVQFRMCWNANFDRWRFGWTSSQWWLQKSVAGVYTTIGSGLTTPAPAAGDVIEVVLSQDRVICKVNGAVIYQTSDPYLQGCCVVGLLCTNAANWRVDSQGFLFGS